VRDRDPPIRDYFPKNRKRSDQKQLQRLGALGGEGRFPSAVSSSQLMWWTAPTLGIDVPCLLYSYPHFTDARTLA
jgi:hypothetical protein